MREFDVGEYEGRSDAETWEHSFEVFHAWIRDGNFEPVVPGGETYAAIRQRFVPFVLGPVADHGDTDAAFICVGHGGTYRCMLPLVLSNIDLPFVVANGLTFAMAITAETRGSELVCLSWGDMKMA